MISPVPLPTNGFALPGTRAGPRQPEGAGGGGAVAARGPRSGLPRAPAVWRRAPRPGVGPSAGYGGAVRTEEGRGVLVPGICSCHGLKLPHRTDNGQFSVCSFSKHCQRLSNDRHSLRRIAKPARRQLRTTPALEVLAVHLEKCLCFFICSFTRIFSSSHTAFSHASFFEVNHFIRPRPTKPA